MLVMFLLTGHSVTSRPKPGLSLVLTLKCFERVALLRISQQIRGGGQREFSKVKLLKFSEKDAFLRISQQIRVGGQCEFSKV